MAIALVTGQTVKVEAGSGTSWTGQFAGNVTTGNLLSCVGCGFSSTAANHAVSDTNNSTSVWTQRAVTATQNSVACSGSYAKNATGGTTPTVTFNAGTGSTGGCAWGQEWSGCDATTPFTTGESGSGTGAVDGTHTTTSATNTTNANSVYVGGFFNDDASNPCGTMTWNNSWTKDAEETNASSFLGCTVGHLIVSTSSSRQESVTFTHTTGTADWAALFMIFQQAGGAAGVPPGLGPVVGMQQPQQMGDAALAGY